MNWTLKRITKVMIPVIGIFIISVKEWDSIDNPTIEILYATYHSLFVFVAIIMIGVK